MEAKCFACGALAFTVVEGLKVNTFLHVFSMKNYGVFFCLRRACFQVNYEVRQYYQINHNHTVLWHVAG